MKTKMNCTGRKSFPIYRYLACLTGIVLLILGACEALTNPTYTVSFNVNGGDAASAPASLTVSPGSLITKPEAEPTRQGYTFTNWYKTPDTTNEANLFNFQTDTITGNTTLYAGWGYTVSFHVNGGDVASAPASLTVSPGSLITKPQAEPTRQGYIFTNWYKTPDTTKAENLFNFQTDTITGDTTLYAGWESVSYTVQFIVNSEGYTNPATQHIQSGGKATEPSTPDSTSLNQDNKKFAGWCKDLNDIQVFNFDSQITEDITLYAIWSNEALHTVIFISNGITVSELKVLNGAKVSRPELGVSDDGYIIENWYREDTFTTLFDFDTDTISADLTLYAKRVKVHKIDFISSGTSIHTTKHIKSGEVLNISSISPPAREGYEFDGWSLSDGGAVLTGGDLQRTFTADTTIYAIWTKLYTVQFNTNGGSAIADKILRDGTVLDLSKISPTRTKYHFDGWYISSPSALLAGNDLQRTITADATFTARWTEIHTISIISKHPDVSVNDVKILDGKVFAEADIVMPSPQYALLGWYSDSSYSTAYTFGQTITSDITIYSDWHLKNMEYIKTYINKVPAADDLANYDTLCREALNFYKPGANIKFLYVSPGGSGSGTSWSDTTSLGSLIPRIDRPVDRMSTEVTNADEDNINVILVAAGDYNTATYIYSLYNHTAIIGGWNGWDRSGKSTIKENQLRDTFQNSIQTTYDASVDRSALLYGFTLEQTSLGGSSIEIANSSPVLIDIVFKNSDNIDDLGAGGLHNKNSNPLLIRPVFHQGAGSYTGVAMRNENSSPIIIQAVFSENIGHSSTRYILNDEGVLESEKVVLHASDYFKYIFNPSTKPDDIFIEGVPAVTKYPLNASPAISNEGASHPILINATLRDNYSISGTIANIDSSSMNIINTIVWGNKSVVDPLNPATGYVNTGGTNVYSSIIEGVHSTDPRLGTETRALTALDDITGQEVDFTGEFFTNELQDGSPAINAGLWIRADKTYENFYYSDNGNTWYSDPGLTSSTTLPDNTIDITALDGRGKTRTNRPDMGAWEYGL